MYHSFADLLRLCGSDTPVWRVVLDGEIELTGSDEGSVLSRLSARWDIMTSGAYRALTNPLPTALGLISGVTAPQYIYANTNGGICGTLINRVMAFALSSSESNAAMGKICAAPTAGACGILPAVLLGLQEARGLTRDDILHGLLTASGAGAVITRNATVSGAEGGCQAECGVAAAMAAAAAVELCGGTPAQSFEAVSIALTNCMGLVCDPVAGLVQTPCAQRNASQAVNALLSADLALAGMRMVIPTDEVVEALRTVGRSLPSTLRETAQGGLAATETGRKIAKRL